MPEPYSEDLRLRMIFQRIFYERSYAEIASQLFFCPNDLTSFAKTVRQTIFDEQFLRTSFANKGAGILCLTNIFYFCVRLYCNRSTMTSCHDFLFFVRNDVFGGLLHYSNVTAAMLEA